MTPSHIKLLAAALALGTLAWTAGCDMAEMPTAPEPGDTAAPVVLSSTAPADACVAPPDGIVGWWPLDETTGTTAADIVAGNDGAHAGGPTPTAGLVDGALAFDGSDDEVQVGSLFEFHKGDATLEFWINTPATRHQSVFWTRADNTDRNRYNLFVNGDDTFGFDYRTPAGSIHILVGRCCTGTPIPTDTWAHLAITRSGSSYSLYVDGVLQATATDAAPDLPTAAGWQMSGRSGYIFQGSLDEVTLYDRALSADEILAIAQAGAAGKCKGAAVDVEIDVKPGSSVNPINLDAEGDIPVAILTTDAFDAASVDPLSVVFGPGGAAEAHRTGHLEDVDGDGDDDLVLHFLTAESGIAAGDTVACLTGLTADGTAVRGCDAIRPIGG